MKKFSNQLDLAIRRLNYWADGMDPGMGRFLAQGMVFPIRSVWHLWRNRKYLSLGKIVNMSLANLECLWGRDRLRGLPYIIKIEPTNICNTTCQLCPTGLGVPGRTK